MLYINDINQSFYTYDDVVALAIKSGIDPKRAYIYLAGLGVKGVKGRVMRDTQLDYSLPIKLAVINNKLVSKVDFCKKCKGLIIE